MATTAAKLDDAAEEHGKSSEDEAEEIIEEDELDEMTTTNDIAGYSTPFAFDPEGERIKKKYGKKKNTYRARQSRI